MKIVKDSDGMPRTVHECPDCKPTLNDELLTALRIISNGAGPFSSDPYQHAVNTIEEMKRIAREAIEKALNEKGDQHG